MYSGMVEVMLLNLYIYKLTEYKFLEAKEKPKRMYMKKLAQDERKIFHYFRWRAIYNRL